MSPSPPRWAEGLVRRILGPDDPTVPSILGDLREDHAVEASRRGIRAAHRWYVREALLLSAGHLLRSPVRLLTRAAPMDRSLLSALRQDVVYAARSLRRSPGFALFTAAVIGLGVGASTAVFSVLQPFILAPLPFADDGRLVWIANEAAPGETSLSLVTSRSGNLRDFRAMAESFEGITGYNAFFEQGSYTLTGDGPPERLVGVGVAHDFLQVLGVQPHLGRGFTPEEGLRDGPRAVILGHGLWVRRFGGAAGVVGRTITLEDEPFLVAGVLPPSFDFSSVFSPGVDVDLLLPFPVDDVSNNWGNTMFFIGRLRPGITVEAAQAEVTGILAALEEADPDRWGLWGHVTPLKEQIAAPVRPALALLAAAAALVLLIVCVNVTNLLLSRVPGRARELAVRKAFGASRGRLMRLLVLETMAMSLGAAAVGGALAWLAVRAVSNASGVAVPLVAGITLNGTSLLFATGLALATGLVVSVVPALQVSDGTEAAILRAGGRGAGSSRGARRLQETLVVAEMTLACVLLVVGGLLGRSLLRVMEVDLGFDPEQAVAWQLNPGGSFQDIDEMADFYMDLTRRVGELPGVLSVGLVDALPLGRERTWGARIPGEGEERGPGHEVFPHMVDAGYLETMGIPVLAGRGFSRDDRRGTEPVVVLNESAARRIFGTGDPVGRTLFVGGPGERTVVGVVADIRHSRPEVEAGNQLYFPLAQVGDFSTLDLVVRASAPLEEVTPRVAAALAEVDPTMPIDQSWTLQSTVDTALSPRRFTLAILGAYGAVALLLAGLGVYGVLAQSVAERRSEIGIRMALGATSGQVLRSVLGRTLLLAGLGIAAGTGLALATSRVLESMLFGVTAADPVTFGTMVVVLLLVATAAGGIPAWRAARTDGLRALQAE